MFITGDDLDLQYQFQHWAEHLKQLCVTWQKQVQLIPMPDNKDESQSWGPSENELLADLVL